MGKKDFLCLFHGTELGEHVKHAKKVIVKNYELSEMEEELDEEEEESSTCDICDKTFANTKELKNHFPQHHQFQEEISLVHIHEKFDVLTLKHVSNKF